MVKAITVRNVPDEVTTALAARAARSGHSMQEYLRRELIRLAEQPDIDAVVAEVRRAARASGAVLGTSAILAARDADRR